MPSTQFLRVHHFVYNVLQWCAQSHRMEITSLDGDWVHPARNPLSTRPNPSNGHCLILIGHRYV